MNADRRSKTVYARSGSVWIPIFRSSVVTRGKRYPSYVIRWKDLNGQSQSQRFSKLTAAKTEAERIAEDLATANASSCLTQAQIASFTAGVHNLRYIDASIENATAEYAETMGILATVQPRPSLPELARFYIEHKPKAAVDLTVADAVAAYLVTRIKKGISKAWHGTLKSQLNRFASEFNGTITAITADQVDAWVLALPDVSAVTRNNHLAAVQALYNLPALAHAPHREAIQALDRCGEEKAREQSPRQDAIWTPAEFRKLLDASVLPYTLYDAGRRRNVTRSHLHLLPMLVLGGFCKLRNESEAMRARWESVHLADRQIYTNGKTGERLVTLTPNAVEWLKLCKKTAGPIWPWGEHKLHKDLRALAARCELEWRPNALRKSASTYAMKLKPDADQVSGEAGNSPAVMRKYYLRLAGITKAKAREWFSLRPAPKTRVIVPLQAETA